MAIIKEFSKQLAKYIALIIMGCLLFSSGLFIGCKSFDPVRIPKELNECNDMYTTMRFYIKAGIKSDALIATMAGKCNAARKEKKDADCLKWIYDDGKLNKKKFPEYAYYLECIK